MLTDIAPGATLRTARLHRGLTLTEAAAAVRVSTRELELLEDDAYERLPSGLHARTWLRRYADLMGLDPQPLLLGMGSLTVGAGDPDDDTDPFGFPAGLRPALRFEEPSLARAPSGRRRSRRRGGRHLAPPPLTYVAYPEPAWVRPIRRVGRPRRSRLAPPLLVIALTAALTIVLYVMFAPAGDASEATPLSLAGTVHVIDGSGDPTVVAEAIGALRGYELTIVSTERLADPYYLSAVLAPRRFLDEAAALVAADPRFGTVRQARDMALPVDLYVVVGRTWPH